MFQYPAVRSTIRCVPAVPAVPARAVPPLLTALPPVPPETSTAVLAPEFFFDADDCAWSSPFGIAVVVRFAAFDDDEVDGAGFVAVLSLF